MILPERNRLKGTVEVDETFIDGIGAGTKGREAETKSLLVIAVEVEEKKLSRIRFRIIPDASTDSLIAFIKKKTSIPTASLLLMGGSVTFLKKKKNMSMLSMIFSKAKKTPLNCCLTSSLLSL